MITLPALPRHVGASSAEQLGHLQVYDGNDMIKAVPSVLLRPVGACLPSSWATLRHDGDDMIKAVPSVRPRLVGASSG